MSNALSRCVTFANENFFASFRLVLYLHVMYSSRVLLKSILAVSRKGTKEDCSIHAIPHHSQRRQLADKLHGLGWLRCYARLFIQSTLNGFFWI